LPNSISTGSPLIIGHRGASAVAPENTLTSFGRAFADGAVGIELDVRLARDGIPVVIHDASLRRTALRKGLVAETTSSELGTTEVGSWFNRARPQLARAEYTRQFVPTLDQVLAFVKNHPQAVAIYVEMKTDQAESTYVELSRAVVQLILDHALRSRVVVVSFNLKAVAQIKMIDPSIRTGALFEPRRDTVKIIRKHPMIAAARECGAEEILLHRSIANRRNVALSLEGDLLPVVWTVDDPKWVRRAESSGIHAVITNHPATMVAVSHTQPK
jgi:glycerophosphoryl diester phosphodiesterase